MNSQFTGNNGCVAVSVEALYDVGHFLVGGVETKRLHRDLELFAIDAVGVICRGTPDSRGRWAGAGLTAKMYGP